MAESSYKAEMSVQVVHALCAWHIGGAGKILLHPLSLFEGSLQAYDILRFTRHSGPAAVVTSLCSTGGIIFGDLPPYEAFPIGGTNSVRGYSEGGVGSGRSYVAGTAELHYPIYGPVEVKADPFRT